MYNSFISQEKDKEKVPKIYRKHVTENFFSLVVVIARENVDRQSTQGTWARKTRWHVSTWARKHAKHIDTWARKARNLACSHKSDMKLGFLARRHLLRGHFLLHVQTYLRVSGTQIWLCCITMAHGQRIWAVRTNVFFQLPQHVHHVHFQHPSYTLKIFRVLAPNVHIRNKQIWEH